MNETLDLTSYDHFVVAFSGGKDSIACVLHLLEVGVPKDKIELWHHDVDGREGNRMMDWPVTADYCRKVADALDLPIYFSWKEGGFEREMLRSETPTARTWFETPEGLECTGGKGPNGTREKFPQVSADLKVRWCSAYLKIDVGAAALRNQKRFEGKRTLFVTGERAEESKSRSRYKTFETHRTHSKRRHADAWRPVHAWTEEQVWDIIKRWKINPHPAYKMGWSRLSCALCIFGNRDQMASGLLVLPEQFESVATYEELFGVTIKRNESIRESAEAGVAYGSINVFAMLSARSETYDEPVFLDHWTLPSGAFGESVGPT